MHIALAVRECGAVEPNRMEDRCCTAQRLLRSTHSALTGVSKGPQSIGNWWENSAHTHLSILYTIKPQVWWTFKSYFYSNMPIPLCTCDKLVIINLWLAMQSGICADDIRCTTFAAVEPLSLKQYCRLAILKYLQRESYDRISELPLPKHLQVSQFHWAKQVCWCMYNYYLLLN